MPSQGTSVVTSEGTELALEGFLARVIHVVALEESLVLVLFPAHGAAVRLARLPGQDWEHLLKRRSRNCDALQHLGALESLLRENDGHCLEINA